MTEKANLASAEVLARCNLWVGVRLTVAASIAAATVLTEAAPAVTGVAALTAAIASGLLTFLKPKDAQERHLRAGRRMNALQVQIRQALRLDLSSTLSPTQNCCASSRGDSPRRKRKSTPSHRPPPTEPSALLERRSKPAIFNMPVISYSLTVETLGTPARWVAAVEADNSRSGKGWTR